MFHPCKRFSAFLIAGLLIVISNRSSALDDGINDSLIFPVRGAFYYVWYPQTWTVGGVHVSYDVDLGYYSSDDPDVVDQHIQDMDYAKIDVAIASWWGIDKHNQENRIPMLLDQTIDAGSSLKWAIYYEKEGSGNPTVEELRSDLDYLMETYADHDAFARIDGKPVVFVYNADDKNCEVAQRWAEATNGEWFVNLKVFGGFRDCADQPDSWHQYGPASPAQQHHGHSFVISPGFWRADEAEPRLQRDIDRWNNDIRAMMASKEPWQLITTFNEWGEGTAIERCHDWSSETEYGLYLDALHNDGQPGADVESIAAKNNPLQFELAQNFPNPFNPSTTIRYSLKALSHVTLEIRNMQGRRVTTLVNNSQSADSYEIQWNGTDDTGVRMASGLYFYELRAKSEGKDFIEKRKMMLMR